MAGKEGKLVHQYLYLQIYPSDELARSRAAAAGKKRSLKCYGPPVFVARPWHALVWALPNGPKLRPTSVFLQREKYQCFLSTHNLVSPSMAAKARFRLDEGHDHHGATVYLGPWLNHGSRCPG